MARHPPRRATPGQIVSVAIYYYAMARVGRGGGKGAVASAAYLSRAQYRDEVHDRVYDERAHVHDERASAIAAASRYIGRQGRHGADRDPPLFEGLYGPPGAPDWTRGKENIERFWNEAERAEKHPRAQLAESVIIGLPHELSLQQNVWVLQDHIREFTRQGRVVQLAIHAPDREGDQRNLHAHLLISTRGVDEHGMKPLKTKEQQERYLGRSDYLDHLRENWGHVANRHLARHGLEAGLDHRSYERQGSDREAHWHIGPGDMRKERQGQRTRFGEHNREVAERNAEREAIGQEIRHLEAEIIDLDAWRQSLEQKPPIRADGERARQGKREAAPKREESPAKRQEEHEKIEAECREIDAWRSGVEQEWQGRGSPVKPIERDPQREAERERLEREAWLDRSTAGSRRLTVEDLARELSPEYRKAAMEMQEQAAAIDAAAGKIKGAERDKVITEHRVTERLTEMPGWKRLLHKSGLSPDNELTHWTRSVANAERNIERGYTHRTTAEAALSMWERRAEAALASVRTEAEGELAQRQGRAEQARQELIRRGEWITEPEAAVGWEREDLAAWHGFITAQWGATEAAVHSARPRGRQNENKEEAARSYWDSLAAKGKRHNESEDEAQQLSQRQRHGFRQGL